MYNSQQLTTTNPICVINFVYPRILPDLNILAHRSSPSAVCVCHRSIMTHETLPNLLDTMTEAAQLEALVTLYQLLPALNNMEYAAHAYGNKWCDVSLLT